MTKDYHALRSTLGRLLSEDTEPDDRDEPSGGLEDDNDILAIQEEMRALVVERYFVFDSGREIPDSL